MHSGLVGGTTILVLVSAMVVLSMITVDGRVINHDHNDTTEHEGHVMISSHDDDLLVRNDTESGDPQRKAILVKRQIDIDFCAAQCPLYYACKDATPGFLQYLCNDIKKGCDC